MTTASHSLIAAFKQAGQGHVFAHFNELDAAQQADAFGRCGRRSISAEVARAESHAGAGECGAAGVDLSDLTPAPYEALPKNGGDQAAWAEAKTAGEEALRAGRVAAFVVAGGQGTRLGYDGPKGTYPVTPVLKKPLFQVFAEKLRAAGACVTVAPCTGSS